MVWAQCCSDMLRNAAVGRAAHRRANAWQRKLFAARAPFLERARVANSLRCHAFAWRRVARSTAA
eukprot:3318913-Lingulodinium_polyedra.AAC.1